jgi:hypothetical protein
LLFLNNDDQYETQAAVAMVAGAFCRALK